MFIYTINKGETLSTLEKKFNVSKDKIISSNNLKEPYLLLEGETIMIDSSETSDGKSIIQTLNPIKKKKAYVNGYSYQGLSKEVLNKYNKTLTTISPFTYKVKEDGTLDDFSVNNLIKNSDILKVMVIANIKEKGGFSGKLAHSILSNKLIKNKLISQCISKLREEKYQMLNIDFEYVNPEDKDIFLSFIIDMKARLKEINIPLSVCLAPKTSTFQKGQLYEAHDYQKIGRVADYLIIMTYEWGYTYGEPMAISPLVQVKDVIRYAKRLIDKDKIIMGIPNYGYDWKLPYKKGSAAESLSINEAIKRAKDNNVKIEHSKAYLTPYYKYKDKDNIEHIVHFDDALSYKEKLELAFKEDIGGLSIWTITTSNSQLCKLIDHYFTINNKI